MPAIGNSDNTIPAIQGSDINDGDIINLTRQETNDKGQVRFYYPMPDGTPLMSEWVQDEHVKAARRQWVEAVRQQLVASAQRATDAAMSSIREKQMQEHSLDIPEMVRENTTTAGHAASPDRKPDGLGLRNTDPVEHARACLVKATEEAEYWAQEELKAAQKKYAAETAASKWTRVIAVLNAP